MHSARLPFPALQPLALALGLGLAASAADASVTPRLEQAERAAYASRVFFPPDTSREYFDSFIVYYRGDSAPLDTRSRTALAVQATLASDLARVAAKLGVRAQPQRRISTGGHVVALDARVLDAGEADRFMRELAANPDVISVEPNLRLHPTVLPNDTLLFAQWGLTEPAGGINAEPAWAEASGSGVVIAVIDTGRTPHPDLDAKTLAGADLISDLGNSRDGGGRDLDPSDQGDWNSAGECGPDAPERLSTWHGTHVAGIAAALTNNADGVAGVAYGSYLQHVRVLGTCGGTTADIADGIVWASGGAVPGLANNATPARVLNLSLGGLSPCSTTYQAAIDSARSRGSVLIVAAGNSNVPAVGATPANCSGVITVAANDRAGARASYSNYGLAIDVAAPGGDGAMSSADSILSTVNLGSTTPVPFPAGPGYDMKDGTSMAAPFVAGIAALMLSRDGTLTPDAIETVLRNTARPFPTYCSGGCGTGIVDASAAVRAVTGQAIAQYPVSVALYGNGQGNVTSAPAGINCGTAGATCSVRFGAGPSVTLQATPAAGFVFAGWAGACSGTSPTCTVPMTRAHAVYATFEVPVQPLANGVAVNGLASPTGAPMHFSIAVPAGASNLRFAISGGSGDADLYVRRGAAPDTETYDCRPYLVGNVEECVIPAPGAGTWFAMLRGDPSFSGVTLRATFSATAGLFCDGLETQAQVCGP